MPKEKKTSLPKKPSSKLIEIPWRDESLAKTFNESTLRTCDVVLMVESEEACADVIHSCYMGYKLNPIASVKIVPFTNLQLEVIEYVNAKDAPDKDKLFEKICTEAISDLEANNTISSELLAHLIKLKINQIIVEDIKMEQEQLFLQMEKEKEYKRLFEGSSGTAGSLPKAKGSQNKPAKEAKRSEDGKKKKGPGTDSDDIKIVTNPPKPFSQFYKGGDHSDLQVEDKHLYIVLTGFYNPELIIQLVNVGVPINCLLEVAFSNQSVLVGENCQESIASRSQDSMSQTETDNTEISEEPKPNSVVEISKESSEIKKEISFESFWAEIIDLMHLEQQHDYLKDIFHMFYKITEYVPPDPSRDLEEQCNAVYEKQFEDLIKRIKEIEVIKRKYTNYVRNLKLQKIPCYPTALPLHCLRVYNKLMNKFPPDCFSIALLIACLLEEVCSRVPDIPPHLDPLASSNVCEKGPFESGDTETNSATVNHGGIRDQVISVLGDYKKRHDSVQNNTENKQRFRCYTCNYDPKIDLKIDFRSFIVHANNELQLMMNCYKKLSKELYTINMNGLRKCKAALLRSRHAVGIVLEKLMNEYNLQSWRKALDLTKDELCDAIHMFLLTKLKSTDKLVSSDTEINEILCPHVTESMLSARYCIQTDNTINVIDESDYGLHGQLSLGVLYRNFSKNVSQILYPASLSDYCYKEYLPGPVLLQELHKASLEYECVEHLYSPLTDTVLFLFHNDLDEFGCANMFKRASLRTPVCIRDFCQFVLQTEKEWIEDQEFLYQTEYRKEVEDLKRKKEELRKALYSEFIPDEYYFILPDSIKAKLLMKDETQSVVKESGKKGGKGNKNAKDKGSDSDKKDKKKEKESLSSKRSEAQLDIEDVLKQIPDIPPKKTMSLHCAKDNEPYSFIAYDLGYAQLQVNGWTSVFQSLNGLKVKVNRTCWLGNPATITINLANSRNNFIFHYSPDLVTKEPFMFHSVLSDGCCLTFSKPVKFQKVEDVICERICRAKENTEKYSEDNSAYERKPQEIYFVSEKQDCVIKSLKVPFSTERNLVLSENLLVPFLDSLEKFNIRAHVTIPSETLRQRQKRRHNLRHRVSNSASLTKTTLSKYASKRRREPPSEDNAMVQKYSPKIIVHKSPSLGATKPNNKDFLHHAHEPQKIRTIPQAAVIFKRQEALQKLKEAIEKHIPLFKICSSRLHKFTYVKRIKSFINIPVDNAIKRVLYKPSYYKTKRTIEIKRCLPLGCVNMSKIKKPAYNIRVSLPSGLVVRDIPGVASEFPCIRQYYIDKGPQCKGIVHEESRTFLRSGNIAIKQCDGNINVLSANGRIFHFEIPYIMKTRTERLNYRDTNVRKIQKRKPPGVPIHAARKSLTTFQKLLHKVLPRRFKHMIDSKESRYYLSRRAYQRAQKKHCTNINTLYLLESQRQPFPEYTVITPDGKKIKVSKSKVYEEQKFYVATDIDFRTEETLYEREDGTCCILNREGVLTTQFPDGTRLTTWFVESPNQVFADEIQTNFRSKDEAMQFDDADDTADMERPRANTTVDFSLTLNQGFVSIFMYYEYSHPNYATVTFGGEDNEMMVALPNDCVISSKEGQKTTVTIGKYLETEFGKSKFVMKARGCDNCVNSAVAVVDLKSWYRGNLPNCIKDNFVYVKDSFEKHFQVDYDGRCSRNPLENTKSDTECMRHTVPTLEKLFSVKSDFSGCVFWNKVDFKALMDLAEKNESFTVDTYNSGDNQRAIVEFKKYISKPYYERYICKYDEPTLKLTKYKTKQGKFPTNPAYVLQNILRKVISIDKIEPLYKCVLDNCKRYGLKKEYENFEQFFTHLTEEIPVMHRNIKKAEDNECLDPCPCLTKKEKSTIQEQEKDEMKQVQALHDKWYKWQQECKKYKQLVRDDYVPLYFKSKYGLQYSDEHRKTNPETSRAYNKKPKVTKENVVEEEEEEEVKTHPTPSLDVIVIRKDDIKVEKKTSVERKPGNRKDKGRKIVKEHLHVSIPKDMVLLYNQGKGDKNLEVNEKKLTARSESTEHKLEDHPEKMLILAGVRDASKVEIANKFLEIHENAKKFDEGSKVVIIAEGSKETESVPQNKTTVARSGNNQRVLPVELKKSVSVNKVNAINSKEEEVTNRVDITLNQPNVDTNKFRTILDINITPLSTKQLANSETKVDPVITPSEKNQSQQFKVERHVQHQQQQKPQQRQNQQQPQTQPQQQNQQQLQPQPQPQIQPQPIPQQQNQQQLQPQPQPQPQTQPQPQRQNQQQPQTQPQPETQQQQQQQRQPQQPRTNQPFPDNASAEETSKPNIANRQPLSCKGNASNDTFTRCKSATDVLKDIVKMSAELLDATTHEQTTSGSNSVETTEKKVLSVLSSLIKMVIEELSKCPEEITHEVSRSITASAYRFICSANMNRTEMELFLKALTDAVDEAVNNAEPCASTPTSESSSGIALVDKTKLIPVKNIGDVLQSYNREKLGVKANLGYDFSRSASLDLNIKGISSVNEMYLSDLNSASRRSSKAFSNYVDNVDEANTSDATTSYQDIDISESLLGFTSKFNFQRFTEAYDRRHSTVTKESNQSDRKQSSGEVDDVLKKRKSSSTAASRVKFVSANDNPRNSLQVIHQSEVSSLTSVSERVSTKIR